MLGIACLVLALACVPLSVLCFAMADRPFPKFWRRGRKDGES